MKKIILLGLMMFVLTGCNVEYNLTINEDTIYESIDLLSETAEESYILSVYTKPIEVSLDSPMHSESNEKLPDVEYYNTSKLLNNGLYQMNINYEHNFNDYKNSNIISNSVSVLKIEKSKGIYIFNTGATLKVFDNYKELNNLTIKIKLSDKFELVSSNADEVINNEYIWNVSRNDYKTNPITLSFKKIEKNNSTNNNENNNVNIQNNNEENTSTDYMLVVFSFIGFIIVLLVIVIFSKKIRK